MTLLLAERVQPLLRREIGSARLFFCVKKSKMFLFPVNRYLRVPSRCLFVPHYPAKSANASTGWLVLVMTIILVRALSQIDPPIIVLKLVAMVYLMFWPSSEHVQNSKSLRFVYYAVDSDVNVATNRKIAGLHSFFSLVFAESKWPVDPCKYSSFWIVVQQRLENFLREFHDSLRWLKRSVRRNLQSDADYLRPCRGTERLHYSAVLGF